MGAGGLDTTGANRFARRGHLSQTSLVWLAMMAYVAVVALILNVVLPNALRDAQQRSFFNASSIVVVTLMGLAGSWCATRSGVTEALDAVVSETERSLWPAVAGVLAGGLLVAYDLATHFATTNAEHFGLASQYTGPLSMSLSFSAAAVIAVGIIDLLPVPAVTYFVSTLLLRGRGQAVTFWTAAALMSVVEPGSQDAWAFQAGHLDFIPVFLIQYVGNLAEFYFFRRAGLVAAVVFRLAVYAVWHVAYPH